MFSHCTFLWLPVHLVGKMKLRKNLSWQQATEYFFLDSFFPLNVLVTVEIYSENCFCNFLPVSLLSVVYTFVQTTKF